MTSTRGGWLAGGVDSLVRTAALVAVIIAAACANDDLRALVERDAGPLLLPGYSALAIDRENVDVGLVVFSYKVPSGAIGAQIISEVRERLAAKYPCYSVQHESSEALRVRCAERSRRLMGDEEFHLAFDRSRGRLFALCLRDVPADREIYQEFVGTLDEIRRR